MTKRSLASGGEAVERLDTVREKRKVGGLGNGGNLKVCVCVECWVTVCVSGGEGC